MERSRESKRRGLWKNDLPPSLFLLPALLCASFVLFISLSETLSFCYFFFSLSYSLHHYLFIHNSAFLPLFQSLLSSNCISTPSHSLLTPLLFSLHFSPFLCLFFSLSLFLSLSFLYSFSPFHSDHHQRV